MKLMNLVIAFMNFKNEFTRYHLKVMTQAQKQIGAILYENK